MTWKPLLKTRCLREGETLLFFPLTDVQTESISSIRFTPYSSMVDVSYERLFIGLGAIPGMPPPLGFLSAIDGGEGGQE
jgi:hypothetical protein